MVYICQKTCYPAGVSSRRSFHRLVLFHNYSRRKGSGPYFTCRKRKPAGEQPGGVRSFQLRRRPLQFAARQ
ncbi:hypothetical protein KCP73_10560 [Salmonella enterica subsp. enterica]|nr:hypothetical protein KCP73_10560 [Salmonella enterica subsp. enterica]